MKKIILLLIFLYSTFSISQTSSGMEQEFDYGIKNNSTQTVTNPVYLTTTGTDGTQGKVVSVMNQNAQTGVISFDGLAVNTDPTKYNIGAGVGYISNPQTGEVKKITWSAQTAQTTPYLATSVATYVLKNNLGTTVLQNSYPSPEQFRTHIYLGKLAHTTFTTILFAVTEPNRAYHIAGDFHDLVNTFGSLNRSGNAITPNGANLQINVSAGETYREGANFLTNRNSPNITTEPTVTATSFRNKFRNGSGGWNAVNTTTVDPNYYDDGSGILQPVPNNKFTVKVVYRFGGTGTIHMDYGQAVYDDLNAADAGIANSVASDPDTKGFASRIGWIIIKQGTTSLLDATKYRFVPADLIGERAATSSPTPTLQAAYDGSVTPQIVTSTGGGAVAIRRGSAADTDNILVGQNGAGTNTFTVSGDGEIIVSGKNDISLNTQAASLKIVDVGSNRNNLTLNAINNSPGANIRLQVSDSNAHIGFNKGGTTNSSLAFLFDNTTTSGCIDFRGNNYVNATDYSQYSRLYQDGNDFSFRNVKTGSFLFKSDNGVNTNLKITNNGELSVGTGNLFTGSKSTIQGDGVILALRNTTSGSTVSPVSRKISWISANNAERAYIDSPDALQDVSGAPIIFATRNNAGTLTERARMHSSGGFSVGNTIDPGVGIIQATSYTGGATLTGTPTAPTPTAGDNSTKVATTAFVQTANSDNVKLTGNQTKLGMLTFDSDTSGTLDSSLYLRNDSTSLNGILGGRNYSTGTFFNFLNSSTGVLGRIQEQAGGTGLFISAGLGGTTGTALVLKSDSGHGSLKLLSVLENTTEKASISDIGDIVGQKITANNVIKLKSYTVATLPAGTQGDTAYVTDAVSPTYLGTLTGGGSVVCPVFFNGTAWVSH